MIKTITDIEELLMTARTTNTVMFDISNDETQNSPIKFDFHRINPYSGRSVIRRYNVCLRSETACDWYPTIVEPVGGLSAHHYPSDVIEMLKFKNAPTLSKDNDELLLVFNFTKNGRTDNMIGIILHVAEGSHGYNLYFKEFGLANRKEAAREFCQIFYDFK